MHWIIFKIKDKNMKRVLFALLLTVLTFGYASAQKEAKIKFDKTTYNFGDFSEKQPVQKCTFTFTNVGDAPLIINQATASCGCTIPKYTKKPVMPGQKGTINVTYNGKGRFPGHFKKAITVRTNGNPAMTRVYIEGKMQEAK